MVPQNNGVSWKVGPKGKLVPQIIGVMTSGKVKKKNQTIGEIVTPRRA